MTTSPASVNLIAAGTAKTAQATIAVNPTDKAQSWTVSVYPANRMAGWLTVSPLSGTGPAQITLSANGAGYGPGAYRASIVIQSQNALPQSITVPVMFVLGGATSEMAHHLDRQRVFGERQRRAGHAALDLRQEPGERLPWKRPSSARSRMRSAACRRW